jgi:hypothetical protein
LREFCCDRSCFESCNSVACWNSWGRSALSVADVGLVAISEMENVHEVTRNFTKRLRDTSCGRSWIVSVSRTGNQPCYNRVDFSLYDA